MGYPLYRQEDALHFLNVKLTEMGLVFKEVQPFVLLIGWSHIPSEYSTQEEDVIMNPWFSTNPSS